MLCSHLSFPWTFNCLGPRPGLADSDNRVSSSAGDVGRDANKWRRACVTFVSSAMTIGIVKCFSHVISFADPSVSALAKNVLCIGSVTKGMHCVQ